MLCVSCSQLKVLPRVYPSQPGSYSVDQLISGGLTDLSKQTRNARFCGMQSQQDWLPLVCLRQYMYITNMWSRRIWAPFKLVTSLLL